MNGDMNQDQMEEMAGHPLRRSGDPKNFNDMSVAVGRLEQSIQNTNISLRDHAARTNNNIDRLTKGIEELTRNQFLGKQTNWGMIASWAAVLILLLGLVVYQPLQEIRTGITDHKEDGHPTSVLTRIANNERRFTDIAEHLQREVTLLEKADKERRVELTSRLKETEDWILEHNSISPKEHAVLFEKTAVMKEEVATLRLSTGSHDIDIVSLEERILDIEREIYAGAAYRSGRPIKPARK